VKKSLLITFDDGLKHVWTVAYPLLKRYGLKATCFLIPGCIPENDKKPRPTLEDYWEHRASFREIVHLGYGDSALATWAEIKIMHESGIIDFQSHTMYHSLVHTSNKIFDFMNPDYDTYFYGNIHIPIYTRKGQDVISRNPVMGMPIYSAQPRMTAKRRFFDDEQIRNKCIETVSQTGVEDFFRQENWSRVLSKVVSDHRRRLPVRERFETADERDKAVFEELLLSRRVIEEKLPGKSVTHLCYPWYDGADFAVQLSKKAGFRTNYFGTIRGRPSNRPVNDPYKIVRLEGFLLQRLPGIGRKKMRELLIRSYKSEII
jgi:hypothetical protein